MLGTQRKMHFDKLKQTLWFLHQCPQLLFDDSSPGISTTTPAPPPPALMWEIVRSFLLLKKPLVMLETWVRTLDWEDPLEEGMATHSSILACRISMDRGAWRPTELDTTEATKQ